MDVMDRLIYSMRAAQPSLRTLTTRESDYARPPHPSPLRLHHQGERPVLRVNDPEFARCARALSKVHPKQMPLEEQALHVTVVM